MSGEGVLRRWWGFGQDFGSCITFEVSYGPKRFKSLGAQVTAGGGDRNTLTLMLGLYFITIWIGLEGFHTFRRVPHLLDESHEFGIYWWLSDEAILCIKWNSNEHHWSRDWRKTGINIHWSPTDFLFGRLKHRVESEDEPLKVSVEVPAGHGYDAHMHFVTVVMKTESWKRSRLPWVSHRIRRAHMECTDPIPHPGKGTTGYNCGEDALHSMCCRAETLETGLKMLVESALDYRRRYPL